jgi:Uma2 family endonuclease
MAATTQVSLEVYLRSCYEPDAEYVDGEIEERPMGEYDHAAWQAAIQKWFWKHEQEWQLEALPELRVQVAPTRFRVPDVSVLDFSRPAEQIITHPPVAVFEILSPEDTVQCLKRKLEDYATMGIPQIWVVDPDDGSFSRYQGRQLIRAHAFVDSARSIHFDVHEIAKLLRRQT